MIVSWRIFPAGLDLVVDLLKRKTEKSLEGNKNWTASSAVRADKPLERVSECPPFGKRMTLLYGRLQFF